MGSADNDNESNKTYYNINQWITLYLEEMRMSQRRLSERTGISMSTIQRLMSGSNANIRMSTIENLEKLLGEYKPSKKSPEPNLVMYEEPVITGFDLVFSACNGICPVCGRGMKEPDEYVYINRYRLKNVTHDDFTYDGDDDGLVVFTCKDCIGYVNKAAEMNYPIMISCIIAAGHQRITVYSKEHKKEVDITNQSLLADKIGVSQSTISRISHSDFKNMGKPFNKRKVIDVIEPKLARDLHILCAKRLSNKDFMMPMIIRLDQAIHHLMSYLKNDHGYQDGHFIRDYRVECIEGVSIKCDLMVFDEQSDCLICCFVADETVSKDYLLGLGAAFKAKYILILVTSSSYQYGWSGIVTYKVDSYNDGLSIRAASIPIASVNDW
jgi:predicted transcriptional regulator